MRASPLKINGIILALLIAKGTAVIAQTTNVNEEKLTTTTKHYGGGTVTKTTNFDDRVEQKAEAKKMSGEKNVPEYIGTGEMHHDGTIILRLTREEAGRRFHDELHYAPSDPGYKSVRKHIGPVKENEIFSVKPFEDN
jgi:hypothetical protein